MEEVLALMELAREVRLLEEDVYCLRGVKRWLQNSHLSYMFSIGASEAYSAWYPVCRVRAWLRDDCRSIPLTPEIYRLAQSIGQGSGMFSCLYPL